jgi:hypothetical protein
LLVDRLGFIELTLDPLPPLLVPIEFWDSSLEYSARRARLADSEEVEDRRRELGSA